ncbi:neuronal acetylcholine receptor subunit alpha-9-II-like [Antedon mediterranea]|uniref:neuronal acetylcholine receptor subunit alpha-9-II-like n=1 Tax=Antedon mediterranea TaxID=105859 RepID=UPI003AF54697
MFHRLIVTSLQTVIPFLLIVALLQNTINGETMHMDVNPSIKAMLLEELVDSYPKARTTRPVANENTTTMIDSTFVLTQVIQLDDVKQILELSGWITMEWQDEFISWNLAETGVECLKVPQDTIWVPDIVLLHNIDKDHTYFMQSVPVKVCYNGSARLSSVAILQTFCHIDITNYPNDRQTCVLEFISWTYDVSKLVFIPIPTDVDQKNEFVENEIWKLPENGVQGNGTVHRYSSSTYASLQYSITLQRRNEFQKHFYLIPYYFCSFLMSVMFLIPYESGERVSYGITVLLAQIVFSQLIVLSLPPVGDNIPEIGKYFLAVIGLSTVCLILDGIKTRVFAEHNFTNERKEWEGRGLNGFLDGVMCCVSIVTVGVFNGIFI